MQQLTFEEKTHTYKLDGVKIPSVTQCTKESGLMNLDFVSQDLLAYKADLGNKVHSATEMYDRDNLVIEKLHPTLRGYLDAWIKFRKDTGFTPLITEQKWSHPIYRYGGRVDRIGLFGNDLSQLDIKSGVHHHSYAIQSAGYTELYNYGKPKKEQIKRRFTVYLKEDGTYKLKEHKDPRDIKIFLACLTITNYKRNAK